MKIKQITALSFAIFSLAACDDIKTKLHLMPNQDEQQCLDSERLNFKDPDVLFVANLGDRGLGAQPDQYWVRYKAKNSYGAYIQGNMLCKKNTSTGHWERNSADEILLELRITGDLLERELVEMRKNKAYKSRYVARFGTAMATPENDAKEIIYTSADSLAKYAEKKTSGE